MKVVMIGAGVAGLAIGWRMQQAGASVTVLERGQPAMGATWASAGMIAVAGERAHAASAEVDFMCHASRLWPDFASELEAASGIVIDYRRNGALLVKRPDAADGELQFLTVDEARRKEPMLAPDIPGALWAPDDAQVDNRLLGRALAAAFQRAGGVLSINEAAVRFVHDGAAVHAVQTPFTHHEADAFVIAAGAWSGSVGGLPPGILPAVKPVKGEIIAVMPPAGASIPTHVVRGEVYLVPRPDRLLIGATMSDSGFDTRVTREASDWLSSRAIRLMPTLAGWGIAERWAGLRPGSPDDLPVLGRTALDRLFLASGQFRNGILFAPAVAENISRLILEQAGGIPEFDPRRFSKG